jgi:hypothetical protein
MIRRQVLVAITKVVFAELACRVALSFHHIGNRRHPLGNAMRISGHADCKQSGTKRLLPQG